MAKKIKCSHCGKKVYITEEQCPYCGNIIKKTTYKSNYDSEKELIKIFEDKFYEIIENKSFYENWLDLNGINFQRKTINKGIENEMYEV